MVVIFHYLVSVIAQVGAANLPCRPNHPTLPYMADIQPSNPSTILTRYSDGGDCYIYVKSSIDQSVIGSTVTAQRESLACDLPPQDVQGDPEGLGTAGILRRQLCPRAEHQCADVQEGADRPAARTGARRLASVFCVGQRRSVLV